MHRCLQAPALVLEIAKLRDNLVAVSRHLRENKGKACQGRQLPAWNSFSSEIISGKFKVKLNEIE